MTELTKLKQLRKNVADTKAAADAAYDAAYAAAYAAAWAAWDKAERDLNNYPKEQQDNG